MWDLFPLLRYFRYVSSQLRCFRAGLAFRGMYLLASIVVTGWKAGKTTLKGYKQGLIASGSSFLPILVTIVVVVSSLLPQWIVFTTWDQHLFGYMRLDRLRYGTLVAFVHETFGCHHFTRDLGRIRCIGS